MGEKEKVEDLYRKMGEVFSFWIHGLFIFLHLTRSLKKYTEGELIGEENYLMEN